MLVLGRDAGAVTVPPGRGHPVRDFRVPTVTLAAPGCPLPAVGFVGGIGKGKDAGRVGAARGIGDWSWSSWGCGEGTDPPRKPGGVGKVLIAFLHPPGRG